MRPMLDCESVFDFLTRAAPSSAEMARVHEHVACCPECREFAATIQPAMRAWQLAYPTDHDATPCTLESIALQPVERYQPAQALWRGLAAMALGLILGGWLVSGNGNAIRGGSNHVNSGKSGGSNLSLLISLQLPAVCGVAEPGEEMAWRCCTECHYAGASSILGMTSPSPAWSRLQLACSACHE